MLLRLLVFNSIGVVRPSVRDDRVKKYERRIDDAALVYSWASHISRG